ncbi:hypothetical protein ASPCADRAFT_133402 [Aspergillus carbonarius ITEM 5010]|uniref:Uncharacterized protein n=1 Tax=Aspergillus carbonarius (strain ITEM 5010) TaxID=602072 RepID=A0A1R3RD28_ASPC5|nr:hypothetical protein ASPCADRAFT_133402 [Aspergillus carbonarius ITEM 5010]
MGACLIRGCRWWCTRRSLASAWPALAPCFVSMYVCTYYLITRCVDCAAFEYLFCHAVWQLI